MKQYLLIILVMLSFNAYAGRILPSEQGCVVLSGINEDNVKMYPNPAINTFFVEVGGNQNSIIKEVSLYSLLGTPVLVKQANGLTKNKIEINISGLKKGKYLVKITFTNGTSEVRALIKQ